MANFLKDRFFNCFKHFNIFLVLTGVFTNPSATPPHWKRRLWSVFWLIFCVQSNVFIVVKRSCLLNRFIRCFLPFQSSIGTLTNTLIRLSTLLSDTTIHVSLISTIKTTMTTFLERLENVDNNLKQPCLTSVQRSSLVGLVYLVTTVYLNLSFSYIWELQRPDPFFWVDSVQNGTKVFGNQWFTPLPSWIFFICGQLIVLYFRSIQDGLKHMLVNSKEEDDKKCTAHDISNSLRCIKELNLAVLFLHRRFSVMLLATCFFTALTIVSSSYFFINFIEKPGYIWASCWEATDVIDSIIRFWILGYTSDQMRQAASDCIPLLREIRDDIFGNDSSVRMHHKITLYIIEIATVQKDVNRLSLYGLFPLTKRLTLKVSETALTFLIIMVQFN